MTLPIRKVIYPACLQGQPNGRLGPDLLVDTPGLAGGPVVRLVAPAALAWRAMADAAYKDGVVLKATSLLDSYRPYAIQERIFQQRYTTTHLPGRPSRSWNGKTWWQKPGTAAAAVPGTSNHGLGLAVDTGTELDGDAGTESLDDKTLAWLLAHAAEYGWSWELASEPWHLRYVAGDVLIAPPSGDDMPLGRDLDDDRRSAIRGWCWDYWNQPPTAGEQDYLLAIWRNKGMDATHAAVSDDNRNRRRKGA